jgi:hypothetical protein
MTITTQQDNKVYDNLCTAIKSLSPENKYAFVPFLSVAEHEQIERLNIFQVKPPSFRGVTPNDQNLQSFTYGNTKKSLEEIIADALDPTNNMYDYRARVEYEECGLACKLYEFLKLDDKTVTVDLMSNIIRKAANQMSECLHIDNTELSFQFVSNPSQCDRHKMQYNFHKDSENSGGHVRLTFALNGKGTAFTKSDQEGRQDFNTDVIATPPLHLAVFTQGREFGAIHSWPAYDVDGKYGSPEECERFLIVITGAGTSEESMIE